MTSTVAFLSLPLSSSATFIIAHMLHASSLIFLYETLCRSGHKGLSCKTPPQKKRRNDITAGQLEAAADPARKKREEGKMSKVLYCVN